MGKSFKEELLEFKKENDVVTYNLFNDGSTSEDKYFYAKSMNEDKTSGAINAISFGFCSAAKELSGKCDFDYLEMKIKLGLVFDINDVLKSKHLKEDAKPVTNLLRYVTQPVVSYSDGKKTNRDSQRDTYCVGGYLNYDEFISLLEEKGITFDGPENYEKFLYNMVCNVPFDIKLSVDLKEEKKLTRK